MFSIFFAMIVFHKFSSNIINISYTKSNLNTVN